MEVVPLEVFWRVLDSLPFEELNRGRICSVDQRFADECASEAYWRHRFILDFGMEPETENAKEEYLGIYSTDRCTYGSEVYRGLASCLEEALERDENDLIQYYLETADDEEDPEELNRIAFTLARYGFEGDLNHLLKTELVDLDWPMVGAAVSGNTKLMRRMLDSGATDLDGALIGATRGGQLLIARELLDKGGRPSTEALMEAAKINHPDILNLLITRGNFQTTDLEPAAITAAKLGHEDLVFRLLASGVNTPAVLYAAAFGGHRDLVMRLLDRGDLNAALVEAAGGGHLDLVNELIRRGATAYEIAFRRAILAGHRRVASYLLSKDVGRDAIDEALRLAAGQGDEATVMMLLEAGASDLDGAIRMAAHAGHDELARSLRPV